MSTMGKKIINIVDGLIDTLTSEKLDFAFFLCYTPFYSPIFHGCIELFINHYHSYITFYVEYRYCRS